jgi:hypothetical protein
MTSKLAKNKAFCLIFFFSSAFCCLAQNDSSRINCIVNSDYIELLKEAGIYSKKISSGTLNCMIIESYNKDSSLIRHYYTKDIYFEGIISNGHNIGVWKGYYKNRLLIKIGYLGDQKNRPVYIELWDKKGKYIRKTFLNVIE